MSGPTWQGQFLVGSTGYVIDDIQSISYFTGRRWATDPFQTGSGTLVCRNIAGWGSTKPAMGRDIFVLIPTASLYAGYNGKITDVSIDYGQVAAMDEATITWEGALGAVGRYQQNSRACILAKCVTQAVAVAQDSVQAVGFGTSSSFAAAQTYTGNSLDLFSEIMMTEIGRVIETINFTTLDPVVVCLSRETFPTADEFLFSDVSTDWTAATPWLKYRGLEFKSAAENYFTNVQIKPYSLATQTSGTGKYSLYQDSVDYTTAQGKDHADYLLAVYGNQKISPYSVTFDYVSNEGTTARQNAFLATLYNFYNGSAIYAAIGNRMRLKFRGTTYYGIVEGIQVNADPNNTTVTLFFSPQDTNSYLKWTSPSPYNTWDNNKWGF